MMAPCGIEIKVRQEWRSPTGAICQVVAVDLWGVLLRWPDGSEGRPLLELFRNEEWGGYKLVKEA